ncbi:MAG TPA: selenide, water dikinase SelD [Rectinemataceae bacterium]
MRLTRYTHGLGCACKMRPQALERILAGLPTPTDPAALVGTETSDDAAVYGIGPSKAIVQTVDFFTPVVDDPYHFGAIAAANALSDIYAMGGTPLFALNIVCFPTNRLPLSVLEAILKGAVDKAREAGVSILGGHSVEDTEPKFGMTVTGIVDPGRVYRNSGARPGDALVLAKPLGLGILCTAMKNRMASDSAARAAIETMELLNKEAAALLPRYDVGGVTDITGFGLMGHLREMCRGSGLSARVFARAAPILPETRELAVRGMIPGGSRNNEELVSDICEWPEGMDPILKSILCDAQTSGGLLVSVAPGQAQALAAELRSCGYTFAAVIGSMEGEESGQARIRVIDRG